MWVHYTLVVLAVLSAVNSENSTLEDTCEAWDTGSFGALLEDWATEPASQRQGRVMALPSTKGYYVTERIDSPLVPPPPPHPAGPNRAIPLQGPAHYGSAPPQGYSGPHGYNEWDGNGKIVNKPPSPYKDKFRPSYQQQQQQQGPARPQAPNGIDRVDEPPRKQVTETDLYLLSAIEKLVYRADLMEKRLRKLEESLHYVIAGAEAKPEPCMTNYTRVGAGCYQWSREAADWKGASVACRQQRAALLELDHAAKRAMVSRILSDKQLKGKDFWTGGLNPGLLWIWSHSARPVEAATNTTTIAGEGRCLALVYDPAINNYVYRGQDCALKHRYVCQKEEDKTKLSNEIERASRKLNLDRPKKAKLLWDSTDD